MALRLRSPPRQPLLATASLSLRRRRRGGGEGRSRVGANDHRVFYPGCVNPLRKEGGNSSSRKNRPWWVWVFIFFFSDAVKPVARLLRVGKCPWSSGD